jgi:TPP-dependent pyruvate/acetoin dehydrogenase alpha subunit
MYGKGTALLKGKGGSMHLSAPEFGFMGTSAVVASSIPVAVGAAFANKQKSNNKIVAVFFGDGALDEGDFWESLNVACVMKLPIIFVCEDNGFAVHTPTSQRHGYASITDIVSKFNCNVLKKDTTDVEVIYKLARRAIRLIKVTQLPCFMYFKYYRYLEHVGVNEDFDAGYRSREEFEEWYKRDPVNRQREKILKSGISEEEITRIEREIDMRVENSLRLAREAPFADPSELYRGVFA